MSLLAKLGLNKLDRRVRPAQFNVYDARQHFCRLVQRAEDGETIIIARAGRPVARIVPFERPLVTKPGVIKTAMVIHPPTPSVPGATDAFERNGR